MCIHAVRKQVDRVGELLEDMMQDINRELFVSSAVADITRAHHGTNAILIPRSTACHPL